MRLSRFVGVVSALLLASVAAAPSAGAFHEALNTGDTGFYTVPDYNGSPGVRCVYKDAPGKKNDKLRKIVIKSLWTHGPLSEDTWVGYRFLIKKNTKPFGDDKFRTVFRSGVLKDQANDATVATFPVRTWKVPAGASAGRYRVQVLLYYYEPGSKTKVDGKVRGLIEVYRHQLNVGFTYDIGQEGAAGFCRPKFHPVPVS